jgi:hypothetical protein
MSRKRHKPEESVAKLRQVDVLVSQGQSVADAIRAIGVTEVGFGTSCWMERSSSRSLCFRPTFPAHLRGPPGTIRTGRAAAGLG